MIYCRRQNFHNFHIFTSNSRILNPHAIDYTVFSWLVTFWLIEYQLITPNFRADDVIISEFIWAACIIISVRCAGCVSNVFHHACPACNGRLPELHNLQVKIQSTRLRWAWHEPTQLPISQYHHMHVTDVSPVEISGQYVGWLVELICTYPRTIRQKTRVDKWV